MLNKEETMVRTQIIGFGHASSDLRLLVRFGSAGLVSSIRIDWLAWQGMLISKSGFGFFFFIYDKNVSRVLIIKIT